MFSVQLPPTKAKNAINTILKSVHQNPSKTRNTSVFSHQNKNAINTILNSVHQTPSKTHNMSVFCFPSNTWHKHSLHLYHKHTNSHVYMYNKKIKNPVMKSQYFNSDLGRVSENQCRNRGHRTLRNRASGRQHASTPRYGTYDYTQDYTKTFSPYLICMT